MGHLEVKAGALTVKVRLNPGVGMIDDPLQRACLHPTVDDHTDAVAGAEDGVQIVRDHHHGQPQLLLQVQHQLVELRRADGIQPGGRLIEEQQPRVERQRPRQGGPLDHASRELGRIFLRGVGGKPHQANFEHRELVTGRGRELRQVLDHGKLDVLQHRERRIQRSLLKGDAVTRLDRAQRLAGELSDVMPLDADGSGLRPLQAEDAPEQHGLAGAGAADDAEDLVLANLHLQAIVDHLPAEAIAEVPNLEHRISQTPISMKSTAKSASARITRKMACTTATVVSRPSSREEPRTCMPLCVPAIAISTAKTGALITPTQNVLGEIAWLTRLTYWSRGMCRSEAHRTAPPTSPTRSASTVRRGSESTSPSARGSTSASNASTPVACRASTSSLSFIEPISAAKALPERPATMIAVSSTPSSRSTPM